MDEISIAKKEWSYPNWRGACCDYKQTQEVVVSKLGHLVDNLIAFCALNIMLIKDLIYPFYLGRPRVNFVHITTHGH